ncbi:MAG: class SAM-dependent methyltransferase [Nevskia sp.]|nr:class SAM-dependent methyltransferase [Nevskia sp.]
MTRSSAAISPTAYATGNFWYRHGLSTAALSTPQGRRLDRGFRLLNSGIKLASGVSIDALMLARHLGINEVLARAIDAGRVRQVIEIAAGLSPRGWEFSRRYPDTLSYIETDLPAMAATKARMLGAAGLLSQRHRVVTLDALADDGPQSLAAIAAMLDPTLGTAIITEGLMNYLDPAAARGVWHRIANTLGRFPEGIYLADVYPQKRELSSGLRLLGATLSIFVRGRMHIHFDSDESVVKTMLDAGFTSALIHAPAQLNTTREFARVAGGNRVRVLEAST